QRLIDGSLQLRVADDVDRRRWSGRPAAIVNDHVLVDRLLGHEVAERFFSFAIRSQRPDHILLAPVFWYAHSEQEAVPARIEKSRLRLRKAGWLDDIGGAERN